MSSVMANVILFCTGDARVRAFRPMQSGGGAVVATENLTRNFGPRRAVDDVTVAVGAGEALAIFGPNGAGKTTLLRMLGGILRPSSGRARIGDVYMPGGSEVRRRIGIVAPRRVHDPLRLTRRSRRVKDVQHILGIHFLRVASV